MNLRIVTANFLHICTHKIQVTGINPLSVTYGDSSPQGEPRKEGGRTSYYKQRILLVGVPSQAGGSGISLWNFAKRIPGCYGT